MVGEMNKQIFQPSKSKLGDMDAKYMILIAYFGGVVLGFIPGAQYVAWIVPLVVFLIDKENKFIAFHAMQSLLLEVVAVIIYIIMAIIAAATIASAAFNPFALGAGLAALAITSAVAVVVGIVILIFAILAAIKGYKYEIYEIPLVGKFAEKIVFKTSN